MPTEDMDSSNNVTIIAPAGGRKNFVAFDVPMHKLANYSSVAKNAYFPGKGCKNLVGDPQRRVTRTEFDLGDGMNESHARTIAVFIKNSDAKEPALISLDLYGKDRTFVELVDIWRVLLLGYKLPKHMDDGSIREALRRKVYTRPVFTTHDFKYVVENLQHDKGMVHTVLDHVATLHYHGLLPEETRAEIDVYCKSIPTLWDQLVETANRVIKKEDAKADEREAKRQAREQARKKAAMEKKANGGKEGVLPFVFNYGDFPPLS